MYGMFRNNVPVSYVVHNLRNLYGFQGGFSVAILLCSSSVLSNVAFALSLFVPHLSFFW